MSFQNTGGCPRCRCLPCRCACPCPCPPTSNCCPPEHICPPSPAVPAAATIPFSVSNYGIELGTDAQGAPQLIYFSGFGPVEYIYPIFLAEGEWATGTITFRQDMSYGTAFILPHDATVRNIHVLFSSKYGVELEPGSEIYPFACLAVSNSSELVYTILQDTITYTEPYIGGVEYPKHTLRRGSLTDLDIPLSEGTLVAIVLGIRGVNVTEEQFARFSISGGLFLE